MNNFLQNEIKRQEYMEMRYKGLDEELFKPDNDDIFGSGVQKNEKDEKEETELKYLEEAFNVEKIKILEELGLIINNSDDNTKKEEKSSRR